MRYIISFPLLLIFLLATSICHADMSAEKTKPVRLPNIIWIFAEDLSPDLGCYGEKAVKTPVLDRLAAQGVRFDRAYTTSPVCSTSRSAMMTGMHQNAIGANQHRTAGKKPLPGPVVPFPVLLKKLGYHVCLGGKKLDLNFTHSSKQLFPDGDWTTAGDKPFFMQTTYGNTHRSWRHTPDNPVDPARVTVPPCYPDTPLVRRDIANGLEEVQRLDASVGALLKKLEEAGVADNTLIIFQGDHGRCQIRDKQFLYEGGVRVPLIMRWPGRIKPGTVREDLVSSIDVTAAILAAAGMEVPGWMHGRDLLADDYQPRGYVFFARDKMDNTHDAMRACRDKRFKYIDNLMPERAWCQLNEYKERQYPVLALMNVMNLRGELSDVQARFMKPTKPEEELYDLEKDPHETNNLAADPAHAKDLARLRKVVADWRVRIKDQGVTDEFRAGGWSSKYPTRTLAEWEKQLKTWEARLLSDPQKVPPKKPRKKKKK